MLRLLRVKLRSLLFHCLFFSILSYCCLFGVYLNLKNFEKVLIVFGEILVNFTNHFCYCVCPVFERYPWHSNCLRVLPQRSNVPFGVRIVTILPWCLNAFAEHSNGSLAFERQANFQTLWPFFFRTLRCFDEWLVCDLFLRMLSQSECTLG